jgi:CsoR family transcriptional regulator, copper-sensing transcriptional repressor
VSDPHRAGTDSSASTDEGVEEQVDRADRLQERLAVPVMVAALASVPAVFLTLFDGTAEAVGSTINTASGAVLVAEAIVLFAVSQDRIAWLKRNWWLLALAAIIVPAVLFALAPVQLLRVAAQLVRMVGALRILRVRRILKAGRILRRRAGLDRAWQRVVGVAVSLLVAGFVAVVLADPTSDAHEFLDRFVDMQGWVLPVLAGVLLGAATFIVMRNQGAADEDGADPDAQEATGTSRSAPEITRGETEPPGANTTP